MHKILLAITISCCLAGTTQADIFALGDLPGGDVRSSAEAVSVNGSFVVGQSTSANGPEAFLWSQSGGMIGLGDLPGYLFESSASGVSDDGLVVVGTGISTIGWAGEAFRWTQSGGMIGLGSTPGSSFSSARAGVSSDGEIVAGNTWNDGEPYRWTSSSGMVGIGDLPGGTFSADARAISADGSVIVGRGNSANGHEAYRWTDVGGMIGLGDLPGGNFDSRANDVSADGSVIVGRSSGSNGTEAIYWTPSGGMVGLGMLPGDTGSRANAVSAAGAVVVGSSGYTTGPNGVNAFIWTPSGGMVRLFDYLAAQGDDLSDWESLISSRDMSADGRTIVGYGRNINGDIEAFVATLSTGVVTPNSFQVTRGTYVSGGENELAESDNMDLSLRRSVSDVQSRTEFEIKSVSPAETPSTFEFTLEGAVFSRSNVVQTIELFDYDVAAWELVSTSNAVRSPAPDSVVTATPAGDLSRFVETETMCIEARVRYKSDNPRQRFASNTDQAVWTIE